MDAKTFGIVHDILMATIKGEMKPELAEALSKEVCGGSRASAELVDPKIGNEWWRSLESRRQTPLGIYADD